MNGTTPQRDGNDRRVTLCFNVTRSLHHSFTHTHLVDSINHNTPGNNYSDGHVYPVFFPGQVFPPLNGFSLWFTLTAESPALKQVFFPDFFDSEMDHGYTIKEEPRDPEHP